jgi:phage tail sheath protein FI
MPEHQTPGVHVEEIQLGPRPIEGVPTRTAAFLGETERGPTYPQLVTSAAEYAREFGDAVLPDRYMPYAVRGFFENGGQRLYVVRIVGTDSAAPTAADYAAGLTALALEEFREVALVYAPFPAADPSHSIAKLLVEHCEGHRFRFAAIDSANVDPMGLHPRDAIADTQYAACYAPWLLVADVVTGAPVAVPPGGHVLGIYARVDSERGVHRAPANEVVRGALGLAFDVTDDMQFELNV